MKLFINDNDLPPTKYEFSTDLYDPYFTYGYKDKRKLNIAYLPSACRGYIGENFFFKKVKNKNSDRKPYSFWEKDFMNKGLTYIIVNVSSSKLENFEKNLEWLHKREEEAGVRKSKVYPTQFPTTFVVVGDKRWKDSCWKIMLYTFYIKCICYKDPKTCDTLYWAHFGKYENQMLSKVKMEAKEEIFDSRLYGTNKTYGMHDREGFVSICMGKNIPMSDLLGLDVKENANYSWPRTSENYCKKKKQYRVLYKVPETDKNAWVKGYW